MNRVMIKMFCKVLRSGVPMGAEMKLADVSKFIAENPKTITEQLGKMLGGKGRTLTNTLESSGGLDTVSKELGVLAQKYPEAAVKLGIKYSKKGGFGVAQATVRNGKKRIATTAVSVSKDGAVKVSGKGLGEELRAYVDKDRSLDLIAKTKNTQIKVNGTRENLTVNIGNDGEIAHMHAVKKESAGTKLNFEVANGLTTFECQHGNDYIDGIADNARVKELVRKPIVDKLLNAFGLNKKAGKVANIPKDKIEHEIYKTVCIKDFSETKLMLTGKPGIGKTSAAEAFEGAMKRVPTDKSKFLKEYYDSLFKTLTSPSFNCESYGKDFVVRIEELEAIAAKEGITIEKKVPDYLKEFIKKNYN